MSVPPPIALRAVHDALTRDVLPALTDDRYAESALKASLGILRKVAAEIDAGDAWCTELLDEYLPLARRWPQELSAAAPDAAADVRHQLADAARMAVDDPRLARDHLLGATERVIVEAWSRAELRYLLTEARQIVRADLAAEESLAR